MNAADAPLAAALLAVDPVGLGGARLRGGASPQRQAWLDSLRDALPEGAPWRRLPVSTSDSALLGGLDLASTLHSGRPIAQRGLLAQTDGGVLIVTMAERMGADTAAKLALVLDRQSVSVLRDGLSESHPARVAVVALDEGQSDEEHAPAALCERLAFAIDADTLCAPGPDAGDGESLAVSRAEVAAARERLHHVRVDEETLQALCATALSLGVDSMRAPLMALRAARAAAALAGLDAVEPEHAMLAARLVLAPRATRWPSSEAPEEPPTDTPPETPPESAQEPPPPDGADGHPPAPPPEPETLDDQVVEAAKAAIPPGLLALLRLGQASQARARGMGRHGQAQKSRQRGRPIGSRRGEWRDGERLHVLDTLRAAAPWQRLRAALAPHTPLAGQGQPVRRLHVRRDDFHVVRWRQRRPTTTVFVVDASGSSALHRLAEAKGAVELLLADCYVRRDRVAVIAFRGAGAELLLPPTRSLARAKRGLSALPGGGGTPLASAIDAASDLAAQLARQGDTPVVVLLTDGRANIARDGSPGRARAAEDALTSAQRLRAAGCAALLIDTSPQPQAAAAALAQAMQAAYLPLPHAGSHAVSAAVRLAGAASA